MRRLPERIVAKRVVLRRIALEDAAEWKSFNNRIAARMEWPRVPSIVYARNELLHYMHMWETGERYVYAVTDKEGRVIGDVHIKSLDWKRRRAEFGHALHPRVWGTGITYEVLDAIKAAAKRRGLQLWGRTEVENVRAWRSLEKYRATFKGTRSAVINGKRKTVRVYEL